ncbi:type III restriction protein res subunit [Azoarcus sp. CIB]|nr:type III restriction protein res subunit [Azoarcus sp. CIB]
MLLEDGRLFVVAYKGELTAQTDDTREKHTIGELWVACSCGKGLAHVCVVAMSGTCVY